MQQIGPAAAFLDLIDCYVVVGMFTVILRYCAATYLGVYLELSPPILLRSLDYRPVPQGTRAFFLGQCLVFFAQGEDEGAAGTELAVEEQLAAQQIGQVLAQVQA